MDRFQVHKADLTIDAPFAEPRFDLLADEGVFLKTAFRRLGPHGLRLGDIRIERANGLSDQISCHLINYWMTVRFKLDRVEIACTDLPRNYVDAFRAAIPQALHVVTDANAATFPTIISNIGLHGVIENRETREYLKRFVQSGPQGLGPATGNGVIYYFGADESRLSASALMDLSAVIPEGIFFRLYTIWDGRKVQVDELFQLGQTFVDRALASFALERS